MERIDGGRITEADGLDESRRRRLAANIVSALIAGPIWADEQPSLFHADPHAGNLMLTPDGRIGLLDWSLVGRLGKRQRICMTQILIGALTIDAERIVDAMLELGEEEEGDPEALRAVVEEALAPIRAGALPGLEWLTALMDATAMKGARYGAGLIIFRKVLQMLQGGHRRCLRSGRGRRGAGHRLPRPAHGGVAGAAGGAAILPGAWYAHVQRRVRPPLRLVAADCFPRFLGPAARS